MNRNIPLKLLLFVFSLFIQTVNTYATKYALIVAISNYEDRRWNPIHSTNDTIYIKQLLKNKGFENKNIYLLINEKASKKNIIETFKKGLIEKAKAGDIFVFHFSGHGQQVMDTNNDETDGFDEALVCYDAQCLWSNSYKGQNHLKDDELNVLVNELSKKTGKNGQIIFFLDACFSGSMTRDNSLIRSTSKKMAPEKYQGKSLFNTEKSGVDFSEKENNAASIIFISACRQDQQNTETIDINGNPVGSLTYALYKTFANTKAHDTWKVFYDNIKLNMANFRNNQTPQAEGQLDFVIFKSEEKEYPSNIKIIEIISDSVVRINQGEIAGIYKNTELDFFPQNCYKAERSKLISKATVTNSCAFYSDIKLHNIKSTNQLINSWGIITKKTFPQKKITVKLNCDNKNKIIELLKNNDNLTFSDSVYSDLQFSDSVDNQNNIFLKINNNFKEYLLPINKNSANEVSKKIANYTRYLSRSYYLRDLKIPFENNEVEFSIIPGYINANNKFIAEADTNKYFNSDRNWQLPLNKSFTIRITNKSNSKIFYQLIDITSNDSVFMIIPIDNKKDIIDYQIEPNTSKVLDNFQMTASLPCGQDILKLVVSTEPLTNLYNIINDSLGAEKPRGEELTPFENELFNHFVEKGVRGIEGISLQKIGVISLILQIN